MPTHLGEKNTITSRNPADGTVVGEVLIASDVQIGLAAQKAKLAQPGWAGQGLKARLKIIRRFQRILHARKNEVALLISREAGKPVVEALTTEVLVVLDSIRFLLNHAHSLLRPERVSHGNPVMWAKRGRLLREPHGVIGIISPWNYPLSIPATESIAALVAGNAVILKPSEFTPIIAMELRNMLREAGVPDNVFQVLNGAGPVGAGIIESGVDKMIFTGSVRTGKRVAELCASRLLPVVLELGGKDPMIVLRDADLNVASSGAVWGAFVNAGQTCLSIERCYVPRGMYDQFLDLCVKKAATLRVGLSHQGITEVGPLIHEQQVRIVEQQVEEARQKGARVLFGGYRMHKLGQNFYSPTVLADVNHSMRIMREETFGPVLPIMPYDNEEEAIKLANDSDFGLAASVWTRSRRHGERVAARLNAGTVMINDAISGFGISEAPHGGVKASGIGRTHGKLGFDEMVRVKYVDTDLLGRMRKMWWYKYDPSFGPQMLAFIDALFAPNPLQRLRGWIGSAGALFRKQL